MNNPYNQDTIEAIVTLKNLRWSNSKISRALGINRKKIAKILESTIDLRGPTQDSLNSGIGVIRQAANGSKVCMHCGLVFVPDPRHVKRQNYCSRAECQAMSKRNSQRSWVSKNPDYWT